MVDLKQKKVGIVACSGEELAEGTVTRLAALRVLEELRPQDTVTICLPLFLAGGEGDRAFAKFYPTIAIDGCELRCAARATEMHSGAPAAEVVISELVAERGLDAPEGLRRLNAAGQQAVDLAAERTAELVDELLEKRWSRKQGRFIESEPGQAAPETVETEAPEPVQATCACGSGIPIQKVQVGEQTVTLVGLPLILEQLWEDGKAPGEAAGRELLETVKVYNPIVPAVEAIYEQALLREYRAYCEKKGARS